MSIQLLFVNAECRKATIIIALSVESPFRRKFTILIASRNRIDWQQSRIPNIEKSTYYITLITDTNDSDDTFIACHECY